MRPVPPWLEGENNKLQHGDLSANQQGRAAGASRPTRISRWLCILLTDLLEGQEATVLQLPAQPKTPAEEAAQRRVVYADMTTDGMVRHPSFKGLNGNFQDALGPRKQELSVGESCLSGARLP
jgi:hypothetical protein